MARDGSSLMRAAKRMKETASRDRRKDGEEARKDNIERNAFYRPEGCLTLDALTFAWVTTHLRCSVSKNSLLGPDGIPFERVNCSLRYSVRMFATPSFPSLGFAPLPRRLYPNASVDILGLCCPSR